MGRQFGLLSTQVLEPQRGVGHAIRHEHSNGVQRPLYLGESGENSNVWFRDAIHLLEDLNIGWAWWPLKKIESISGSMSIEKTEGYQSLLNYWEGNGPEPSWSTPPRC